MRRNLRLISAVYEPPSSFMDAVAKAAPHIAENLSSRITDLIWGAYDQLCIDLISKFNRAADEFVLEDSITAALEPRIRDRLSRYEPFYVQHQCPEEESALDGSAQTPKYDFAFVARGNERTKWPVEAKVLRTDGAVAAYVADLREQFLTCRYAPHSSEGAMVGYLLSGIPSVALNNIAKAAGCTLEDYPPAAGRDHKTSTHDRAGERCASAPNPFRCHHLVLEVKSLVAARSVEVDTRRNEELDQ